MTDVAAAGQISQADIIERQAETIALLQHQVQKGTEYKQLTKTKLKEAAARLREYRLRVEALLKETEEARQALKQEKEQHTKTKRTAKLSRKPKGRDVAVQTDVRRTIARQTQTQLSGQMDHVKTRRTVDCGVQTETEVVSRKRGRDQSDGQDGGDQLVPRLSRDSEPGLLTVRSVEKQVSPVVPTEAWKPQVLQMEGQVGFTAMPFTQETSAALDAELASSDSEGDDDQVMVDTVSELILTEKENGGSKVALPLLDPDVSNDIDKDLESSSDEEEDRKEEGASTGIISNGIQQKQAIGASDTGVDGAGDSQNKRVLVSIDDELDDEFATLDSDSEPENQEEKAPEGKRGNIRGD
ncbi:hypothetical protein BBO99_00007750 [Phytophthora kernoviae]|uniref:Uncharacterized protein n=1 Tax=Phytophthora kernoviae TaxID=325452 RepID=A0A421GHC4_9STRA|nr:hypothetical protein BBI17_007749 [Phytophthora kernoviae]RLN76187.1 hypothetical protein BBO99_00007750 [Phytophthora kernoviae]